MAKVYNGAGDFVLFPREHPYVNAFDPQLSEQLDTFHYNSISAADMHRSRDYAGQAHSSYDSYPQVSAYSSASSNYYRAPNMQFDARKGTMQQAVRRNTPSGSPSPANSQIFDQPSSNMSSASGASANSTASSTDGSPYAHAMHSLPYQDKWSGPPLGLGIPEIVNSEGYSNEPFPPTSFNDDLILEDSKFATYVGECGNNFSRSFSISPSVASSSSSVSASQGFLPAFPSPILALDTTTASRDVTIDSILEEANSKIRRPVNLLSPVSAASPSTSPKTFYTKRNTASPTEQKKSFRSPLTPASATSRFSSRAASPYVANELVPLKEPSQQFPPLGHPCGQPTPPPSSRCQSHFEKNQNPFFGQSSGRFVAPLESSCWFSLLSPFYCLAIHEVSRSF